MTEDTGGDPFAAPRPTPQPTAGHTAKHALWVIGAPGVGTSTVFRMALDHLDPSERFWESMTWSGIGPTGRRRGTPYLSYPGGVELGRRRVGHGGVHRSGSDALPLDCISYAEEMVSALRPGVVVGEGDRLAHERWFTHLIAEGYAFTLVVLACDPAELVRRRQQRTEVDHTKRQSPVWIKGRETKVTRLTDLIESEGEPDEQTGAGPPIRVVRINVNLSPQTTSAQILQLPAIRYLETADFFGDQRR